MIKKTLVIALSSLTLSAGVAEAKKKEALPEAGTAGRHPLREAYYGDLHLHTSYSFDAYINYSNASTPDLAYRFARGEAVPYLGQQVQRERPLDFLAVTDHSENIGVLKELDVPESPFSQTDLGKRIRREGKAAFYQLVGYIKSEKRFGDFDPRPASRSAWERVVQAANANYRPGKFTTFIGYEWTAMPDFLYNLHRNVIFRGDRAPYPFTSIDSQKPEDLWTFLEKLRQDGVEALAIPHNGNASNGLMYDWVDSAGRPIDERYAQRRAANEPLTEISQNKGQSETHPSLSATDELANFELLEHLLVNRTRSEPHGSYVREAYGRGLVIAAKTGTNPYKLGVVGGSDFHSGLSTSEESAYTGIHGVALPSKEEATALLTRKVNADPKERGYDKIDNGSGNLTGVWAEENTRPAIYDALRRKETFATTGTRLKFRFFGGWSYGDNALAAKTWVKTAYADGVPMGGDLPPRPPAVKAPRFIVQAVKDPIGANLDRVQVVKVWLAGGKHAEKVFDVAFAGSRKPDPKTGKLPAIQSTVDLATATYQNSVGATALQTVWRDPEFDPATPAVYYLRVLEIPTPRWSTILAVKRGLPLPKDAPAAIQERGWSSPIWYTPPKS